MILSRFNLKNIQADSVELPPDAVFELPEKVLQFGTGVLLRGLPDYFIDKANRMGIFNGRVIVVKSTDGGDAAAFDKQDGLYTLCVRGMNYGQQVSENTINASISRVLSAKTQWNDILQTAHLPQLKVIISNTTEVGIQLIHDNIFQHPPQSFPGKLLAFLYERYQAFSGSAGSGMVIVPTELIPDNGRKLESIVLELAHLNGLSEAFIQWLESSNYFCSSLVDRIVPGAPTASQKKELVEETGYRDELVVMAEYYRLWAIEGNEHVRSVLSFALADKAVIIAPNITIFRELKLRMLNGTHTVSCGLAYLGGFETVREAMESPWMSACIQQIMLQEIALSIPYPVDANEAQAFGIQVLDRFRNEAIQHHWLAITMQYSSKWQMRVVPVLLHYYRQHKALPTHIVMGFAAWLLFMRAVRKENGKYFGLRAGKEYLITDDKAELLYQYWTQHPDGAALKRITSNPALWGDDLDKIPGFTSLVRELLLQMMDIGVDKTIQLTLTKIAIA